MILWQMLKDACQPQLASPSDRQDHCLAPRHNQVEYDGAQVAGSNATPKQRCCATPGNPIAPIFWVDSVFSRWSARSGDILLHRSVGAPRIILELFNRNWEMNTAMKRIWLISALKPRDSKAMQRWSEPPLRGWVFTH
ncbi:hypothetical protein ABNQ39_36930 (plasmid) [Azospirillum sp. A26]|uniref:hypothetical protein n=1 Tax=Azospirillum sp. A26 TaxID=3160607 RepID=UPI003671604A